MKKIRALVMMVVVGCIVVLNNSLAYAADSEVVISSMGNFKKEKLTVAEMEALSEILPGQMDELENNVSQAIRATYEPYRYSESFNIYIDDRWVACISEECIVWHYSDGKVHLYSRTISVERLASLDADRTYGRIVNTDGSLSYTTGDRVRIIEYMDYWDFAIDFRVTPTEASFDCYEV